MSEPDLTSSQHEVLDDLANHYQAVFVRSAAGGTGSVYFEAYDESPPEDTKGWDAVPVRVIRVMPSGWKLDVSPGRPGVRSTGGQL